MAKDGVLKDLEVSLRDLGTAYPALAEDRLFSAWFIHAYITEDLDEAVASVTGQTGDKNADAILIDKDTKTVSIIQAKYRKSFMDKTEKANDIYGLAALAEHLYVDSDEDFSDFLKGAAAEVAAKLKSSRDILTQPGWTLSLLFVTLGKTTTVIRENAEKRVRKASRSASFGLIDGARLLLLLRDYLDGAAPPVASVELPVENGEGIVVKSSMNRFDSRKSIDSWVFPAKGSDVGNLFLKHGRRIFARNVRGYLGEKKPVNEEMIETIKHHPDLFFYLNNGLTIVCDAAEKTEKDGREVFKIANPQIINGQQTTRSLATALRAATKTSVAVRVIRILRRVDAGHEQFETMVTKIVQGTNWQNAITQADLMANDRRQIEIERALRAKRYIYLRKREKKGDAHKKGFSGKFTLKKEELAQAVAGCIIDPAIVRAGVDNLFSEERYAVIFPNSHIEYYLPKYWLMKAVTGEIHGEPRLGYMKWLVLNVSWSAIAPLLAKSSQQRIFWDLCQKTFSKIHKPLSTVVGRIYSAVDLFYKANRIKRGEDGERIIQDESNFFKNRRNLPEEFDRFWKSRRCSKHRAQAARGLKKIENLLV